MNYERHEFGRSAEARAAEHMLGLGFEVLEKNFRSPCGELDLVCRKASLLVFVEVRARRRGDFMHPLESLDRAKLSRLRRSAEYFVLKRRMHDHDIRFDVICAEGADAKSGLEHIENAIQDD